MKNVKEKSVGVIMSVFNAEEYIQEQIDSILRQVDFDMQLWIRDDGSTDGTLTKLKLLYGNNARLTITTGQNLGAARSFVEAIFSCNLECNYYAFSDADDIWISDKTAHSVKIINGADIQGPVAVATRLQIVDRKLNFLGYTAIPKRGFTFENALVQTVASGASTTMNKAAFRLLRSGRPDFVVMHDAWTYLVITAFGRFFYSEYPTLLYRQHGANVFGTNYSFHKRVSNRIKRLFYSSNLYLRQAEEFSRIYSGMLSPKNKIIITAYINYKHSELKRLKFAIFPTIVKQSVLSNLYMRLLILFGRE